MNSEHNDRRCDSSRKDRRCNDCYQEEIFVEDIIVKEWRWFEVMTVMRAVGIVQARDIANAGDEGHYLRTTPSF